MPEAKKRPQKSVKFAKQRPGSSRGGGRSGSGAKGGSGGGECSSCKELQSQLLTLRAEADAAAETRRREAEELRSRQQELEEQLRVSRCRYGRLCDAIVANCPEAALASLPSNELATPTHSTVERVLQCLVECALHPPSEEARVVELETRVTQLSADVTERQRRCMLYERLLQQLHTSWQGVDSMRRAIADAFLLTNEPIREAYEQQRQRQLGLRQPAAQVRADNGSSALDEFEKKISLAPLAAFPDRSAVLQLKAPDQRQPGNSPVRELPPELHKWICDCLNFERRDGGDWRQLASRLGYGERLAAWSRLASPMAKLMAEWGSSDGATVRLLHRHLCSPDLRSPLLARKLQEHYKVD